MQEITSGEVLVEQRDDHIAVVTINRPEARNAVNGAVAQGIGAAIHAIESDPDIWVAVLTGAGGQAFSAGADLKEVSSGNIAGLRTNEGGFAGITSARRSKPWIAAVEGFALAGGCEMALSCDLIVASRNSAFGLPEVARGLVAAAGGLYRLPRVLPRAIAYELILTAGRLPAERAAELGMVNRLADQGMALEAAINLAGEITTNAPIAVRESLAIAKKAMDFDEAALQEMSEEAQVRITKTEDFLEGPRAFVEKRPANWTGR